MHRLPDKRKLVSSEICYKTDKKYSKLIITAMVMQRAPEKKTKSHRKYFITAIQNIAKK